MLFASHNRHEYLPCSRTHTYTGSWYRRNALRAALRWLNASAFYGLSMHLEVHERNCKCIISVYHQINRIEYGRAACIDERLLFNCGYSSHIDDWKTLSFWEMAFGHVVHVIARHEKVHDYVRWLGSFVWARRVQTTVYTKTSAMNKQKCPYEFVYILWESAFRSV